MSRSPTPWTWEATTTARVSVIGGTIAPSTASCTTRPARVRVAASWVSAAAASGRAMSSRNVSTNGSRSTVSTKAGPTMAHR